MSCFPFKDGQRKRKWIKNRIQLRLYTLIKPKNWSVGIAGESNLKQIEFGELWVFWGGFLSSHFIYHHYYFFSGLYIPDWVEN